jgi:hypothetical protein
MVGGFRVERVIGTGATGAVYEATQLSLRRAVALRVIEAGHFEGPAELARFDARQSLTASLHHRNLVPFYEAGEWSGGRFVAMRLIRGRTLAELSAQGSPPAAERLEPIADALRAAHAAGLGHGRVSAENVLVEPDGTAYLADLGLHDGGSPEEDEEALAAVAARLPAREAPPRRRRIWRALAAAAVALAALPVVVVLTGGGDDEPDKSRVAPPPPAPNTAPVGSALGPEAVEPRGCTAKPTANTAACTIAQTRINGRAVTVPRAGVIRSWAVRGASGELALQVLRERGGRTTVAGFTQPVRVIDPGPRAFRAEIAVRPGDRIAIRLGSGSTIGARDGSAGSSVTRWDGALTPDSGAVGGTALTGELMLRADVEAGARPAGPPQLHGSRAASAPAGRELSDVPIALPPSRAARAVVVELPGAIAVDVVTDRRLARLTIPDADPDGELVWIGQSCGPAGVAAFCLRWRNPNGAVPLLHAYRVTSRGRIELIG